MDKKRKKPTVYIESGNRATAIVGHSKKSLPEISKKVVKRQLSKKRG